MHLQRLRYLDGSCAIGIGLDHADEFRLGLHEAAIVVQVVDDGPEIHFQRGLVYLLHQQFGDLVESEGTCSLQQDDLTGQGLEHFTMDELLNAFEEIALWHVGKLFLLGEEDRTYTYKLRDASRGNEF